MSERTTPKVGSKAPALSLADGSGKRHSLADHAGRRVVVYFYPKDDTPGCTIEACDFRDAMERLATRGVDVIGVSPDSSASHAKFATKYSLPFTLLSDPDKSAVKAWGAWGQKNMYGNIMEGVIRSTYLVDEKGRIAKAWPTVKAAGHVDEILTWLDVNPKLHAAADTASAVYSKASAGARVASREAGKKLAEYERKASIAAAPYVAKAKKVAAKAEKRATAEAKKAGVRATKALKSARKDATKTAKRVAKDAKKRATSTLKTASRAATAAMKAAAAALKSPAKSRTKTAKKAAKAVLKAVKAQLKVAKKRAKR